MKYGSKLGSLVLMSSLILTFLFLRWALGPLSFEKAQSFEEQGHALFEKGDHKNAAANFLKSAKITTSVSKRGLLYRYAALSNLATGKEEVAIELFEKSLAITPDDITSKNELVRLGVIFE